MHRLVSWKGPKCHVCALSSASRRETICLGQRLLIGPTAEGGVLDAVRNVSHMRDVHTWSGVNAIRDIAESVCGITDYNIRRGFYTTRHYRLGAIGHTGRRCLAPGFDSPGSDT